MSNESVTRVSLYLYFAFIPLLQLDVFRASLVSAALYENWDFFFFCLTCLNESPETTHKQQKCRNLNLDQLL